MAYNISYHFQSIPEIDHKDFKTEGREFTVALLAEGGLIHQIFLPYGCRLNIQAGAVDNNNI